MNLFKRIIKGWRFIRSAEFLDTMNPRTGLLFSSGTDGGAGDPLRVATVYRCVQILSDSVAKLKLQQRVRRDGVMVPVNDDGLSYLLETSPNPQMSAFTLLSYVVADILLNGNAYIIPEFSSGKPSIEYLWRVNPSSVSVDMAAGKYTVTDPKDKKNVLMTLDSSEVIHIIGMPSRSQPGMGVSVISYAADAIATQRAGDRETRKRFQKGGNLQLVISNDNSLEGYGKHQKKALDSVAEMMERGVQEERRFIPLPGDLKITPSSLSSADMQFLENRKYGVLDICRFFGVPPSFVFADTASNYKSSEMAFTSFRSETLDPLLTKIECEFRRKLIPREMSTDMTFTFDRTGLFTADMMTQIDFATKAVGIGINTPNEARKTFNMPAVEGGDEPLMSANFKTLATLKAEGEKSGASSEATEDSKTDNLTNDNNNESE